MFSPVTNFMHIVLCVGYFCNISIVFEKIVKTIGKLRNFKKFYRILTIVFLILILKKHCTFSVLRLENFKQNFTLYIFTMHIKMLKNRWLSFLWALQVWKNTMQFNDFFINLIYFCVFFNFYFILLPWNLYVICKTINIPYPNYIF